jgi:hypothetical protein
MDDIGFIALSYVATLGSVAAFAFGILRRARRTGRSVPRDERPWT